jgi:hypothetical protein
MRSISKRKLPKRVVLVLAFGIVVAFMLRFGPLVRAAYRSTDEFLPWPADPRVRYEPGAETMAAEVAAALPEAIRTVERRVPRTIGGLFGPEGRWRGGISAIAGWSTRNRSERGLVPCEIPAQARAERHEAGSPNGLPRPRERPITPRTATAAGAGRRARRAFVAAPGS